MLRQIEPAVQRGQERRRLPGEQRERIIVEMEVQEVEFLVVAFLPHALQHHHVQRVGVADRAVEAQRLRPGRVEFRRGLGIAAGEQRDVVSQAPPVPRSASAPPVRCRHTAWAEQPPSAEQPARCASHQSPVSIDVNTAPLAIGTGMPRSGTFSHLRSSLERRALLPHRGLADAITPDQTFCSSHCCEIVAQ